jgi:hypothetical protein
MIALKSQCYVLSNREPSRVTNIGFKNFDAILAIRFLIHLLSRQIAIVSIFISSLLIYKVTAPPYMTVADGAPAILLGSDMLVRLYA